MEINKRSRTELKSYFVKNAIPTESNFAELIEGMLSQKDDGVAKTAGDPLSIEAAGDDTSQKKAINLYRSFADEAPAWSLTLNPRSDPNDSNTARPGLSVSDALGNSRLFVDQSSGNVGIGVTSPPYKLTVSHIDSHLQLRREEQGAGGKVLYLELYQDNPSKKVPAVFPSIRFHHNNLFWHRLEARTDGFHFKEGNLPGEGYRSIFTGPLQVSGDASISGILSFGSKTRQMVNLWAASYGIGIQSGTQYFRTNKNFAWYKSGSHHNGELNAGGGTAQMVIKDGKVGIGATNPDYRLTVRDSANHLQLRRQVQSTGGKAVFLELYQHNPSKNVPEVFPSIRFHHNNVFWHRLEARSDGFHFKHGNLTNDAYRGVFTGPLRVLTDSNPVNFTSAWSSTPDKVSTIIEFLEQWPRVEVPATSSAPKARIIRRSSPWAST